MLFGCFQIYMAPLQASLMSDSPIITQEEYSKLFPRLDIIIGLNTELLGLIYDRVSKWTDHTCIADVFIRMAAFFKMYTEYCSKYEQAAEMYRHLVKTRSEFASFLSKVENLQDIHGLDLPSFLILPCQRIPRYLMLLTELNKWTWTDHPDKENLEEAVAKWRDVAAHVNDSMDQASRMNELLQIERKFNNSLNLVVPHRKFIKQGAIHKVTSRLIVTPTYFLFTDILVYGYPSSDESQVKYKGTIELGTAWIRNLEDTDDFQHGFQLVTPHKAYTLYLDTAKEKREWVLAIETCINRLVAIDPMLVTKRATQVKKTARVGQNLWNLFTKDLESYNASEDAIIKESVSSLNQSLAARGQHEHHSRNLMPVRSSLEFNWTDMRSQSPPQSSSTSMTPNTATKVDKHEKKQSSSSAAAATRMATAYTGPTPGVDTTQLTPSGYATNNNNNNNNSANNQHLTLLQPEIVSKTSSALHTDSTAGQHAQKQPLHPNQPQYSGRGPIVIKQGITREEDPNGDRPITLDYSSQQPSKLARKPNNNKDSPDRREIAPTEANKNPSAQPPAGKTKRTSTKLVGDDRHYSPLLGTQQAQGRYGSSPHSETDPHQQHATCCSSGCTIL